MRVAGQQMVIVREWPEDVLGLAAARAELGLNQGDFELAVQLGEVRTVPGEGREAVSECRVVTRAELERLRAGQGFPDALRDRLRLVGTAAGAELLGTSRARFGKLARAGCFRPARWYVNRYQAVVWLYLASEVREFATAHGELLAGRLPAELRARVEADGDLRARGWRARRVERLVADADDAWQEAAVWAALLGPREVVRMVPDPSERDHLRELLPALPHGRPGMHAARAVIEAQLVADDPEEVMFGRLCLGHALDRARAAPPAPWVKDGLAEVSVSQVVSAFPAAADELVPPYTQPPPWGLAASPGWGRRRRSWRRLLHGTNERRMRMRRSTGQVRPVAER
ncbi:DUF6397 family protein [Streptantibioticus ferralitis]|uniref:DUF6397 family protein n=1 Tax=Streptantibioticus ferralitis TaxID=236510 RepID=A0ABT5YY60_9ACTN|nr:DUF6397 family protein [Streptantibioticus ferralitis]MDF2256423.1 DUF6397 family protein [Streptantibioticus ferralitis]